MTTLQVDFGRTAEDYATHRAGFPAPLFERLAAAGVGRAGQTILDLGTGTGCLARGLAQSGATVTGLDPSEPLLAQARRLDEAAGVSVRYVVGTAESTGLADARFDVVAAGQCWHWFDKPQAAHEAHRLLRPRGRLLIAYFDWLPLPGNVVAASEALIEEHNPAWTWGGGTGLHPEVMADVALAGFTGLETFSFDLDVPYSHIAWRGRIRASAGVGGSLPADKVAAFDRVHGAMLAERFPHDPLQVPHRVFAMTATT